MDGPAFKLALRRMGHNQSSFARQYDLSVRTVQNWAKDGPPHFVGPFIEEYARRSVEPPASQVWLDPTAATRDCEAAIDQLLRDVLLRAAKAGWPRDTVLAAALRWISDQVASRR